MIRIIIIRNLIILKGEIMTFHYMVMANHAIYNRMLMEILEETGLTAGQASRKCEQDAKVLDYLGYHDGASQKEIAAHCYIEAATLTSVLNGMEAKALIERRRLNGNRRTFHIFLTQKGRQQQQRVMEAFQNIEEQTFDGMPEEEVEQFMELYGKIHRRLTDRPMK